MKVVRHSQAQLAFPGLDPTPTDRLFLALAPSAEAARQAFDMAGRLRARHGLKGEPLALDRLHVSLCWLGDFAGLPHGFIDRARAAAARVTASAFEVGFDHILSFARPVRYPAPVVLASDLPLIPLADLQLTLAEAMAREGITCSGASRTPHMTLLYDKVRLAAGPVPVVEWTAREFVLIHSWLGETKHVLLGRWPLA